MKRLIELLLLRMDPIKRMSLIEPVYTRSLEEVYKIPTTLPTLITLGSSIHRELKVKSST